MFSSAHKWNDLTLWILCLWLREYSCYIYIAHVKHQLDLVLWAMVLWVRTLDGHLSFLKYQASILFWAINLWARKVEGQTMAAGEISKQAINVWLERYTALLMVVPATIMIAVVLSWFDINHNKKSGKYQRKTSLASLTALDRGFLEEADSPGSKLPTVRC